MTENKTCLLCQKTIRGRSDKKFCNDYCRNYYNNKNKPPLNDFVKKTNQALLLNRKILEDLLEEKNQMKIIEEEKLDRLGFQFELITSQKLNKSGTQYNYCYEFGFFPLHGNRLLVFRK